jgi:aldose 1-epimerase
VNSSPTAGLEFDVDADHGARLSSLRVGGRELLWNDERSSSFAWGCYPMIPWAGRVRRGHFAFRGEQYTLPITMAPHAIHGTCHDRRWRHESDGSYTIELGPDWPFGGRARQRFDLINEGSSLHCTIEVTADARAMPVSVGWHPWFRRPVTLSFLARSMYKRDPDGIPDGTLVTGVPGPWDDCFTNLVGAPQLAFLDGPTIMITSSCDHWVVYDQPEHAVCVEPQSGPPDAFTLAPRVIEPYETFAASMTITVIG